MQIDLPTLEKDLYAGDVGKQAESKLSRIETILDELQEDPWLSRALDGASPALVEKIEALRETVEEAKTEAAGIE